MWEAQPRPQASGYKCSISDSRHSPGNQHKPWTACVSFLSKMEGCSLQGNSLSVDFPLDAQNSCHYTLLWDSCVCLILRFGKFSISYAQIFAIICEMILRILCLSHAYVKAAWSSDKSYRLPYLQVSLTLKFLHDVASSYLPKLTSEISQTPSLKSPGHSPNRPCTPTGNSTWFSMAASSFTCPRMPPFAISPYLLVKSIQAFSPSSRLSYFMSKYFRAWSTHTASGAVLFGHFLTSS